MSYMAIVSDTYTYTDVDIETVVRRFTADIVMIAQSSSAITEAKARDYAHDVEVLAKKGYLKKVDLTLFSGTTEVRATQYVVNTYSGDLTMSRPGGVLWPRVADCFLRIILSYTDDYTAAAKEALRGKLRTNWTPTSADTSHAGLKASGGRDYASNGWGMQRRDFAA
jgi:Bacterial HORMA domain family 1